MPRLFGTDGVRGVAGRDLTADLAQRLARAATLAWHWGDASRSALVGRDTRVSGEMLETALVAGFNEMGVDAVRAGVFPTAAVAYLTRTLGAGLGVVISASHNPAEDNGIKFLTRDGTKLSEAQEDAIEAALASVGHPPAGGARGAVRGCDDAEARYVAHLAACCPAGLAGLRVVADFANGAAFRVGPTLFAQLGADLTALNTTPDGTNINAGCGSLHPEVVASAVTKTGAQAGVTLDGDADRCLLCDERGRPVDGDHILGLIAAHDPEAAAEHTVVGTVMSNLGLERALTALGKRLERAPVGDRYVWERMVATGAQLGGEPSGHVIFRRHATTGDGLLTALKVLAVMRETGKPLSELAAVVQQAPQVLRSVPVHSRDGWEINAAIAQAIADAEAELGGAGRLLVRASGTEPRIRIMIEGESRETIEALAERLERVVARELGGP